MATGKNVTQLVEPSKSVAVFPITSKKSRPNRSKRGQMTFLTTDETLAVLKTARERSTRDWAMILLAYRHGLRASEVCGLQLHDVDLKAGSISAEISPALLRLSNPSTHIAAKRCSTKQSPSARGSANDPRTDRITFLLRRRAAGLTELSFFEYSKRLPPRRGSQVKSAIRTC
jgi:integrase